MITPYRLMWLDYFRDLADNLNGWAGTKVWRSESAELYLDSASDGSGLVEMHVLMQWPPTYENERNGRLLVKSVDVVRVRDALTEFLRLPPELL